MVYLNNKYCLSFAKFTTKYPKSILLNTRWCAEIEYCADKTYLLTYTIFFYFTVFQANDATILPLIVTGLAVPFRIVIHDYAAAQADFSGPSIFSHLLTGITVFDRHDVFCRWTFRARSVRHLKIYPSSLKQKTPRMWGFNINRIDYKIRSI